MADKKDYYIYVAGEKVLVSKEIYDAITQMDRQERTQSDKDKRNELLRYEELTTACTLYGTAASRTDVSAVRRKKISIFPIRHSP